MSNGMELPLEVDCQTLHSALQAAQPMLLIDCREPDEYALVKIVGARLMPMSTLTEHVQELADSRELPIVVHCHHGGRSLRVARWLRSQGYPTAQSLRGGIDQWAVEIDPSLPRY